MPQFGSNWTLTPTNAFPTSLSATGGGATYVTGVLPYPGSGITLCAESTQVGTISLQRYADAGGLIPIGASVSQPLAASTAAWVSVNDGLPALYFQGTIANTSGSAATVSGTALICSGTPV